MKKILTAIIIALLLTACTKEAPQHPAFSVKNQHNSVYLLTQGKRVTTRQLAKEIEKYPVIFVGDSHANKQTHEFLDGLLKSLIQKGYRIHLANEWFSPSHNRLLRRYTSGKINAKELKKQRKWSRFTSLDWKLSERLYERVKRGGGKLYGINLSRKARKKISSKLLETMDLKERKFYNALDTDVSAHKSLIEPFFENCHKHMPKRGGESCQERMYRVQVAWDSYMAQESAKLAKRVLRSKRDKLIVFAGDMHIKYKLGIPLRFSRLSNEPYFTIINHHDEKKQKIKLNVGIADAIYLY